MSMSLEQVRDQLREWGKADHSPLCVNCGFWADAIDAALLLDSATVQKCARITDGDVLNAWRIWYGDDNESLGFDDMTDAEKTRTRSALAKVWPVPPNTKANGTNPRSEWRPIETAPSMDRCMVYQQGYGREIFAASRMPFVGHVYDCAWYCDSGAICQPTHWMPLPLPPN